MAELVLSAFLGVLFEKLASAAVKNIASYKGIDVDIKKWRRSLTQIQGVLADASQKEITNQSVRRWLNDLQHLAYDIDDVLDDLAYEAMDREFTRESEAIITSKVRKLIPSCCTNFSRSTYKMHEKLDNISVKLQDLVKEKNDLGLRVEEETRPRNNNNNNNRRYQSSVVDPSSIVGRQAEKEALIRQLLSPSDEPCGQNFSVVPIVGMGGVGKTTLARLLYHEKRVKDHFELNAWVCVSDEFDSFGISKVIFQSVTGVNKEFADLNLLQVDLVNHLREKRFLLVLDDVWSESFEDWKTLIGPFHACASGSKIIMTTRKDQLLKKLGCHNLNQLGSLPHDDALSLVALHALGLNNFDSYLSLKSHGEGIVKKCDGLPLALMAIGRLLRTKRNEEDSWKEVLDSEIWKLPIEGEIVPALKLSYHDLSACLKRLFAYCSLFPKDCVFDKEELVLLWMAEGFLHQSPPRDSTEEHMGQEYFDELLSRAFFQHAPNNESLFVMHDMMNDLATIVASDFFVRLDFEENKDIRMEMLEKYRHMSFVRETYVAYKKFKSFERAKSLRTFLATSPGVVEGWHDFYLSSKILVDLLPRLPRLRVLCLSGFCISEVPEFVGTLRHLRYLNLSRTGIKCLPENVCNLYNLETLVVYGCHYLAKLPNNFLKLKNLRHLDIRDTPRLNEMPLGIGELKNLQTLSKIIIGGESGFELTKLRDLKNLCGKISIMGLDKVQNTTDAREANFSQKRLSELEVRWGNGSHNESLEREVLNNLSPRNDYLKHLKIGSYGGLEFPVWVGDPLFFQLKHVSISYCKKCTSLPPLGQLPLLKELFIEGLNGVNIVGLELLGTSRAFPSLEILSFKNMQGWEKWSTDGGVVFPYIRQLCIRSCPNLVEVLLEALPSLNVLEIIECDSGVLRRLVQRASVLTKLEIGGISGLNDVVWRGVIAFLGEVEELSIRGCNDIRYLWESELIASNVLVKLRSLKVSSCGELVSLGEKELEDDNDCWSKLLTSLKMLDVSHCNKMEHCSCPHSLEKLKVTYCSSLIAISLPTGGQKLKSLYVSGCKKLLEKGWGGQKINNKSIMPVLEDAEIRGWINLKSIIGLNYLVHLTTLKIINCGNLESFDNELHNLTLLKRLNITHCKRMDVSFPRGVWPPNLHSLTIGNLQKPISEWGLQNFPTSLVDLSFCHEDGVDSCSQISHLLPSSLTHLEIIGFEKLESVSTGLRHLTSLQHLGLFDCPNIMDLPEVLLPSLLRLRIDGCPNLKNRCSKRGSYWPLISHIPCILLYPLASG